MKNYLKYLVVFLILLSLSTGIASAQTVKPSPRPEKVARVEERQAMRDMRIRGFFNRMITRMEAMVERISILSERVGKRITKLEEAGETVSDLSTKLAEANTLITGASTKIEEAKTLLEGVLSSSEPKDAFEEVRALTKDIRGDLVEAHGILVHIIGEVKGLKIGNES